LTVLLTFFIGKKLYSSRTGFLSGLVLATVFEFAYLSTRGNIDATLTFFTTASFLCFLQWYEYGREEKIRPRSLKGVSVYGFYLSMALATSAKGPVGFVIPLLVSLIYLAVQKDWRGIRRMKLLPGLLLFVVVVLVWYLPAVSRGGNVYLRETLFKHTMDAYAKGWTHVRPFYYHLYNFPLEFLPWFIFLPGAISYGFLKEAIGKRREFLFVFLWFAVIFLFFSVSKGKRGLYLLPLYPAASLMVGKFWEDVISTPMEHFRREWISIPLYGLMGLILVAGLAAPWVVWTWFPDYFSYSVPVAFLLVGGSLALFASYRFKRHGIVFLIIVGLMAGGFFYAQRVAFPIVNSYKSARFICEEITSRIQPGEKLAIYGDFEPAPFNFYTGIVPIPVLNEKEDLVGFLRSRERAFCLLRSRDFLRFQMMEDRPEVQVIARRGVGGDDFVVISNR
jgi:4-amino-4-deoxy-L-arabinose transferase-like glycosyltransferase